MKVTRTSRLRSCPWDTSGRFGQLPNRTLSRVDSRRVRFAAAALVLVLSGCTSGGRAAAPATDGEAPTPAVSEPGVVAPAPSDRPPPNEPAPPVTPRLELVGHTDLGGKGFNGDVAWHEGYAYVGNWGAITRAEDCPASGVKVADVRDPAHPRRIARMDNPEGTSSDDVAVIAASTEHFTGDLAVVGIQACYHQTSVFRGLLFFDVTNPQRPKEIGRWEASTSTVGCHEVDLIQSERGRILASCANPGAVRNAHDEAVFVDATDPRAPELASGWTHPEVDIGSGRGCLDFSVVHNVRFAPGGLRAWVSYWDAGTMLVDISRPSKPRLVTWLESGQDDEDCDNHSIGLSPKGILLVNHEDFSPALPSTNFAGCQLSLAGWGGITVFDVSKPRAPRQIGTFETKGARRERMRTPRVNTVHNTEFAGPDDAFVSWYSEGVRWLDLSDPTNPRQVAAFTPPATSDPHDFFPDVPLVWGVAPVEGTDLILASDINSGLWVLRAVGLGSRAA